MQEHPVSLMGFWGRASEGHRAWHRGLFSMLIYRCRVGPTMFSIAHNLAAAPARCLSPGKESWRHTRLHYALSGQGVS